MSQSTAARYFDRENAIGKVITLNNQFGKTLYTVTSVYEDFPTIQTCNLILFFRSRHWQILRTLMAITGHALIISIHNSSTLFCL
ncbi:MAG: ABC transporter permease [Bacteroidota bacterium]